MPKVRRLFVDPGFSSGWALFKGGKLLAHGNFKTTGSDAKRYWEIAENYRFTVETFKPAEVHVENFPKSKVHVKLLNSIGLYFAAAGASGASAAQDVWVTSWQKWAGFSKKKKEWGIGENYRGEIDSEDQVSAILMGMFFTRELRPAVKRPGPGNLVEVRPRRRKARQSSKKRTRKRKARKLLKASRR